MQLVRLQKPADLEPCACPEQATQARLQLLHRGPFAGRARIIDLSRAAAEQLGVRGQGHVAVRVRRVEPPEADRARLREGKAARERPVVPERVLVNLRAQLQRAGF